MARIRTIKPEFFTSDDICALSAFARLLYIGLWCEADRDGRLEWKPRSFKRRYLPDDDIDIEALCAEVLERGLVRLYGEGLAHIPQFSKHQHINPRETPSNLPDPDASSTRAPRVNHATPPVSDAQGGREGKGKEGKEDASQATRLPAGWTPSPDELRWAQDARPDLNVKLEAESFRDYWTAKPGKDGRKADWPATWRNWIRRANAGTGRSATQQTADVSVAAQRPL